jgi:hypothetical protein
MSKKLICVTSLVLVAVLTGVSAADLMDGLVGWWTFDEGTGSVAADSSGNGNDGTLHGPVEWTADGRVNGALKFTGPYNYVLVPSDPTLNPTQQITIAAWINPSWTGNNRILQKSTEGPDNQYRFLKEGGNNIRVHLPPAANFEVTGKLPPNGEWTHLAATYDHSMIRVYFDAELQGETAFSQNLDTSDGPLFIGTKWSQAPAGDEFNGILDDVRIYNRALTQRELQILGGSPVATNPSPADGAVHEDTWATLTWTPGLYAASHDIYMSTNQSDVQYGTADAFQGNEATAYFVVGFPGFPFPDGLQEGATYYWRVDEVNEVNPDSPWKGDVWKFTVPPKTAWKPVPPNDARLVAPDTDLSWTAGWGAKLHTVYFGETFDDVNDATGGASQIGTTYALDTLELGKTYYWRVDEFDGAQTYKGDVWHFTTGDSSLGGIQGEYFNNVTLAGDPVLVRTDPEINFNWGGNSPGPGVQAPVFSVRWTGMLNVPYAETYTIYANVFEAVRVWVNDELIINNWMAHHMAIEYQAKIDLTAGPVPIVMEIANVSGGGYGGGANMQAQLSWENPSLAKQIIPQTALLLPVWASRPNPAKDAVDVRQTPILRWTAGMDAKTHQVYFGTDENAVLNADASSPEYKTDTDLGDEKYDPGQLEWGTTYYWRVDEISDDDSVKKGDVWTFTTANYLVIEDFENFTDNDAAGEAVWQTWVDGFGVADNGAQAGYLVPPYCEQNIVHGGKQSLPLLYDNSLGVLNSEVTLALGGMDLTQNGGSTLTVWYRGDSANDPAPMYVALDGAKVFDPDPEATLVSVWIQFNVTLQTFADLGVNTSNANELGIGVGDGTAASAGTGTLYVDDIGVH